MVPPEGKEQIRVKMPKGSQDRRQCLRSEGPLCAILVSVSVVGRGDDPLEESMATPSSILPWRIPRSCGTRALPGPQPCCCLSADRRCHRAGDGLCCAVTPGRPGVSGRLVHALHSAGASVDTGLTAHGADGLRSLARHLGIPTSTCGALSSLGQGTKSHPQAQPLACGR